MSHFITRTSLSTTRAIGSEAERSHARVAALIARHVSPRHAVILAEPVPVRDGTGIDWYVEDDGELLSLSSLSAADAQSVRQELASLIHDIRVSADVLDQGPGQIGKANAETLRHAVTFPGEEYIWALRLEGELRPLIVGWGYEAHQTATATPFVVSTFAKQQAAPEVQRKSNNSTPAFASGPTLQGADTASGVTDPGIRTRSTGGLGDWLGAALTLLIALLLLALIVAFLLPACGLRTPFGTIVFGLPGDVACEARAPDESRRLVLAATDLERELQILREENARRQRSCTVGQEETAIVPEDSEPEFSDVIDDRGEYQVTLMWDSPDDLDLHIVCPTGERIFYNSRNGCGGVLDIDANSSAGSIQSPPVENITFHSGLQSDLPHTVQVVLFANRSGVSVVPYRVRVRTPSGTQEYSGIVRRQGATDTVTTFSR